eukprot:TRINITY_DN120749_c0_g1_i1.p1 TRINITY_DN120749_c0_g1~~TRINITY_DN120749_c0_g1_i1.p1  ORF type:complete len:1094 (-),score=361.32 TRINITY_DN120749_c0_g1_i1:53-3334(-)
MSRKMPLQAQFEYDLLGYPSRGQPGAAAAAVHAAMQEAEEEALACKDEGSVAAEAEQTTQDGSSLGDTSVADASSFADSLDKLALQQEQVGTIADEVDGDRDAEAGDDEDFAADNEGADEAAEGGDLGQLEPAGEEAGAAGGGADDASPAAGSGTKAVRQRKQKALLERLSKLAKPKEQAEAEEPSFKPEIKKVKKPPKARPALLLRVRPTNLEEAREQFFASGFSEAPRFTYAYSEEYVTKQFEENSDVHFDFLPEAKRILQKAQDEHGGLEPFLQNLYGGEQISCEEMRDTVLDYLKDHNIEDKVEIRIVDSMLSAANVVKPSPGEKYIVNIARAPVAQNLVPGICDHEVGTHLLRMMNDECQAWHGNRERFKLANPWTTEEGFATLNTYITMPSKLMAPQALRYWAVCRGAQLGFVELFHEIMGYFSDPKRAWQMCCRIKRGMIDTSQPGAFYMDQAYFRGAVEILQHIDEIDFARLYGGQIALQDMDKVHFVLRKEVVRLPRFMNTIDKLKTYKAHCKRMINENCIEAAVERVCKHVFVRTAKEFFKAKAKSAAGSAAVRATSLTIHEASDSPKKDLARTVDVSRLEDLAKPRQSSLSDTEGTAAGEARKREIDKERLAALAAPRKKSEGDEETAPLDKASDTLRKAVKLERLEDLAKPRQLPSTASDPPDPGVEQRRISKNRLLELSAPRQTLSTAEDDDGGYGGEGRRRREKSRPRDSVAPTEGRAVDMARLASLAAPKKGTGAEGQVGPEKKEKKKKGKKKKKTKKTKPRSAAAKAKEAAEPSCANGAEALPLTERADGCAASEASALQEAAAPDDASKEDQEVEQAAADDDDSEEEDDEDDESDAELPDAEVSETTAAAEGPEEKDTQADSEQRDEPAMPNTQVRAPQPHEATSPLDSVGRLQSTAKATAAQVDLSGAASRMPPPMPEAVGEKPPSPIAVASATPEQAERLSSALLASALASDPAAARHLRRSVVTRARSLSAARSSNADASAARGLEGALVKDDSAIGRLGRGAGGLETPFGAAGAGYTGSRRSRLPPTGLALPRASMASGVAAAATASMCSEATAAAAASWKAVPIKVVSLGI